MGSKKEYMKKVETLKKLSEKKPELRFELDKIDPVIAIIKKAIDIIKDLMKKVKDMQKRDDGFSIEM